MVTDCIFKFSLSLKELQVISGLLCARRIPEKSLNRLLLLLILKTSLRRCSMKKSDLENLANFTGKCLFLSHFLINLQAWGPEAFFKRDLNRCIFPAKFLRAPSVKTIFEPLLLYHQVILFTMHIKIKLTRSNQNPLKHIPWNFLEKMVNGLSSP